MASALKQAYEKEAKKKRNAGLQVRHELTAHALIVLYVLSTVLTMVV